MQMSELSTASTMAQILETLPGARRAIFARYHLGGCQSCAFSNEETLSQLCERSELVDYEVLAHLLESHVHDSSMLIDPADASTRRQDFRFIDLRTREEHEAVVFPGAEFFTLELQQSLFASDPGTRLVLFDHLGNNVLDQVAWFRGHGLHQTFGLRGGLDAWSQEVDPSIQRYRLEIAE